MIALEVRINGNLAFTAGVNDWQSLNAFLMLQNEVRGKAAGFNLNIHGTCKAEDPCSGDSVRWPVQYLNVGDEVSLAIIETDAVDPPTRRLKRKELEKRYDPQYTPQELESMDREEYRKLKFKFEKH